MSGPLGDIFERRQLISDQYGAGNNWAQGHMEYGPKYREEIHESVRRTVEYCGNIVCGDYVRNFVRDYYVVVVQLELHTDTRTGIPQTLSSLSSLCTRSVVARAQV